MNDQIISRQFISDQAKRAAERSVASGKLEENPYDPAIALEAHRQWKASFERWLLAASAPDAQGGA